jgi:hypothetical protein
MARTCHYVGQAVTTSEQHIAKPRVEILRTTADGTAEQRPDAMTDWNIAEDAYQEGYRSYFNLSYDDARTEWSSNVNATVAAGMGALLGDEIGNILCQQYGL